MNKNVKNLANEWEKAACIMLTKRDFSTEFIENLLRETYKVCTEYCKKDMVPKDMCKIFVKIQCFLSCGAAVYYNFDELTTSPDAAEYDAMAFIVECIEHGFYLGEYESAYPNLQVNDNKGDVHVLNLENNFIEAFINVNR